MKYTILCIPGIYDSARVMKRIVHYFTEHGYEIESFAVTPNDASISIEAMALQLKEHINQCPHKRFILIGFSMGGIIARYFTQKLDEHGQIKGLITLGSPHNGTLIAHGLNRPGLKDMRIGSKMLKGLNEDLSSLHKIPFLSLWTPCDLMILPATSSIIKSLPQQCVFTLSHPGLITKQKVFQRIEKFLEQVENTTTH